MATKKKVVKKATKKTVAKLQTVMTTAPKVVSYKILEEMTVRSIEDQVNYFIAKGWTPLGGVVLKGDKLVQTIVEHA